MGGEGFSRWLSASLNRSARRRVLHDSNLSLTGAGLLQRISDLRDKLGEVVLPGDVVAVQLPSSVAYLVLQAALVDLGAIFIGVPTDAEYFMADVAERCTPQWYVYPADGIVVPDNQQVDTADAGLILVEARSATVTVAAVPKRTKSAVSPLSSGRIVVATSGSTGRSKLVSLHPDDYWYAAKTICEVTAVDSRDTVLHHLPIQRGAGWLLWGAIAAGADNMVARVRTADLPEALRALRVTATFNVSVGMKELEAQDCSAESLPYLHTLYYSSGPVSVDLKTSLVERFGGRLIQDYGMTEVPEPLVVLTREDHLRGLTEPSVLSSVGRPRHRDRVATNPDATESEPSPVWVRSPHMFEGYWGEPPSPTNRWHETDDIGYFDAEGYLQLVGRRSDSVRSGGVFFSLESIRAAFISIEGVDNVDLAVVADDRLGERVRATVFISPGTNLDGKQIGQYLRRVVVDPRSIPTDLVIQPTTAPIRPAEPRTTNDD